MATIPPERCCQLLGNLLSLTPNVDDYSSEALDWYNEMTATVAAYSAVDAMQFRTSLGEVTRTSPIYMSDRIQHVRGMFISHAKVLYKTLELQTNSFTAIEVAKGKPHDYFEEVRSLITKACKDVLFADRYLDADFAKTYLPQMKDGVSVRLLTSHKSAGSLTPAVDLFAQQSKLAVEVRSLDSADIHDRQLIVDGQELYVSGASFKDGGRLSPSTISQVVDGAGALIGAREADWAKAQKHR